MTSSLSHHSLGATSNPYHEHMVYDAPRKHLDTRQDDAKLMACSEDLSQELESISLSDIPPLRDLGDSIFKESYLLPTLEQDSKFLATDDFAQAFFKEASLSQHFDLSRLRSFSHDSMEVSEDVSFTASSLPNLASSKEYLSPAPQHNDDSPRRKRNLSDRPDTTSIIRRRLETIPVTPRPFPED